MSINIPAFMLCITLFFALQAGCANSSFQSLTTHNKGTASNRAEQSASRKEQTEGQAVDGQQIGKEEAVAIAKKDAAKTQQSLDAYDVVACEKRTLWVVMFDGGGVEYYVSKESGEVLGSEMLQQSLDDGAAGNVGSKIGEAQVIEIAERHFGEFLESYGDSKDHVKDYDAVACELSNAWRVFFEYRMKPGETLATMPNTNPPNYIIEKRTGKIIYTTHQIAR